MNKSKREEVDLLIEGGLILTMDGARRVLDPGFVAVRNRKIIDVGNMLDCNYIGAERFQSDDMVVMPGIINSHDHLDQSVYRSCLDHKEASRDQLLRMAQGLTFDRARIAASLSLLELVHYGVTTTQENHWTHYHPDSTDGVCEAIIGSGMRAVVSRGISDKDRYNPSNFIERIDDVLEDLDRLEKKYDSDRILITAEPTTILRCNPETVIAMRDWALSRNKMWHIHLAQTQDELMEALSEVGMGSVQYAEQLGVLGPEMLAVHCSGLLDEEVKLLGENEVRVAHCPLTVMRGGNIVPPIWELERMGALVAIGTDGSGTNNGQNPWEAMKMSIYMQRVRFQDRNMGTAEKALEMMTIKAAEALGMSSRIGSLEIGKEADIAVFQRSQLHLVPDAKLLNNLVFSGSNNMAYAVFVGGESILMEGKSLMFDEAEVVAGVRETQLEMLKEAALFQDTRISSYWPVNIGL